MNSDSNQIAQKADYIRSKLLCKYGGIWLDSDAIVLQSMDSVFNELNTHQFYGYKYIVPCIWAFACHKEAPIMIEWCKENDLILERTKGIGMYFGELGHKTLNNFINDKTSFFDDAKKVQEIRHDHAWKYLHFDHGIDEYLRENQPFVMLNNAKIDDKFKRMTKKELFESNILLSQFLKKSGVDFNK